MKIETVLGGCTSRIHKRTFPMGSIVLTLDNGMQLVCTDFKRPRNQSLELYVWLPMEKKWVLTYEKNEFTELMWVHYRKCSHKNRIRQGNYNSLMKHDRKHKSGGGGTRIVNRSITDYECTKNPLHDFRKVFN